MLGFAEDTQAPELFIQILHKGGNTGTDGAKIMVIQFLSLGRLCAKERTSGEAQVLPLGIQILGQQEILLLRTHTGNDPLGSLVSEQPQDADRFPADFLHRAKQRGLLIQRFSGIGEETGGNIQASVLDKGTGSRVPGGIATGFKGRPKAAGGEGTGIRFTLDQLFSGELHDDAAITRGADEGVMLFRGDTGHGLEPMGIVGSPLFQGPELHALRDLVGYVQRKLGTRCNAVFPGAVDMAGKPLLHSGLVKYITTEYFRNIQNLTHKKLPFKNESSKSSNCISKCPDLERSVSFSP